LRHATAVTGCSDFTLRDARRRFGLAQTKAQVIFNGVDSAEIEPSHVAQPFERYVVALGRVVRKKGFDLLIDAFARVAGTHPDLGLVIGGDGMDADALRQQAVRLGLEDRVHFTGKLDRAQVAGLLSGAEMLVMPSRLEPFGIVALEGWRAGIPIIVTSQGGASEFVQHEVSGIVVDPENTAELAGALTLLAGSSETRKNLSDGGNSRLPQFLWPNITDHYTRVYQNVTAAAPVKA
jgi:glycogen(starch) synthase